MARLETRKAVLFILRRQAQVPVQPGTYRCTELIDEYIRHTQLNLEGIFGYNKITGHFNWDDTETAARHPNTKHYVAVDTDGFPTRRLETVNFHPPFEYLEGIESSESGQSFYNWMEWPAREEGEIQEEPVTTDDSKRKTRTGSSTETT
jgi:hypothetical protein